MFSATPPDTHKISLKIIEAVQQHPILYVNELKGNSVKLQDFRQKVWKRVAADLGLDPGWVRLRWKNLRDTYCRILKYKNKSDKGVRRKRWVFEDHLSFLKFPYENDYSPQYVELSEDYIQEINAMDNSEGLLEQLEDRNDEDFAEYLEVLEDTTDDPILEEKVEHAEESHSEQHLDDPIDHAEENPSANRIEVAENNNQTSKIIIANSLPQVESKYRKIRPKRAKIEQTTPFEVTGYSVLKTLDGNVNNLNTATNGATVNPIFLTATNLAPAPGTPSKTLEDPKLNEIENDQVYLAPEGKTGIELFFDSMAQMVKRLPAKAQADIKMDICRVVTEAEVKYSAQTNAQTTQQLIAPPGMIPKLVLIPCSMIDNANKG